MDPQLMTPEQKHQIIGELGPIKLAHTVVHIELRALLSTASALQAEVPALYNIIESFEQMVDHKIMLVETGALGAADYKALFRDLQHRMQRYTDVRSLRDLKYMSKPYVDGFKVDAKKFHKQAHQLSGIIARWNPEAGNEEFEKSQPLIETLRKIRGDGEHAMKGLQQFKEDLNCSISRLV